MNGPTLLYLVKQVELAVRSQLDDVVAEHGLTTTQYTALTVLERHPGMTAAALARHSFVRAQTIAGLVGALIDRDLIERQPDPDSRRQYLILLTPAGREALATLRAPVAAIEQRLTATMSPEAVEQLRDALATFRAAFDEG